MGQGLIETAMNSKLRDNEREIWRQTAWRREVSINKREREGVLFEEKLRRGELTLDSWMATVAGPRDISYRYIDLEAA